MGRLRQAMGRLRQENEQIEEITKNRLIEARRK